jgi:hypothetical protein
MRRKGRCDESRFETNLANVVHFGASVGGLDRYTKWQHGQRSHPSNARKSHTGTACVSPMGLLSADSRVPLSIPTLITPTTSLLH